MTFEEIIKLYQDVSEKISYSEMSTGELISVFKEQIVAEQALTNLLLKIYEITKKK